MSSEAEYHLLQRDGAPPLRIRGRVRSSQETRSAGLACRIDVFERSGGGFAAALLVDRPAAGGGVYRAALSARTAGELEAGLAGELETFGRGGRAVVNHPLARLEARLRTDLARRALADLAGEVLATMVRQAAPGGTAPRGDGDLPLAARRTETISTPAEA